MMQVYVGIRGCQGDLFTPEASGGVKGCKALQQIMLRRFVQTGTLKWPYRVIKSVYSYNLCLFIQFCMCCL